MMNAKPPKGRWKVAPGVVLAAVVLAGCRSGAKPGAAFDAARLQPFALAPHPITPESLPPPAVTPPVRINCGVAKRTTDSAGNVWLPDEGFADGNPYQVDGVQIANTADPEIFRTERYGMTAYRFGVPDGRYTVKLLFAEVYSGINGPGERVFSFNVQGHEVKNFDIWAQAGGPDRACIESFDVAVTNGVLNISFTPGVENPKVDGIEILPSS